MPKSLQLRTIAKHYGIDDLLDVVLPRYCVSCNEILLYPEIKVCLRCISFLTATNYHFAPKNNPVCTFLRASIPIQSAISLYYFDSASPIRKILHALKYHNNPQLGQFVGSINAFKLLSQNNYETGTQVVPIPLHPKKLKLRGYNQSEKFASGLFSPLGLPINNRLLSRIKDTSTQTGLDFTLRTKNVRNAFKAEQKITCPIILVDDVLTTGSTLIEAATTLLKSGCPTIHIVTLAYAPKL